jgi:hypothetical protein
LVPPGKFLALRGLVAGDAEIGQTRFPVGTAWRRGSFGLFHSAQDFPALRPARGWISQHWRSASTLCACREGLDSLASVRRPESIHQLRLVTLIQPPIAGLEFDDDDLAQAGGTLRTRSREIR